MIYVIYSDPTLCAAAYDDETLSRVITTTAILAQAPRRYDWYKLLHLASVAEYLRRHGRRHGDACRMHYNRPHAMRQPERVVTSLHHALIDLARFKAPLRAHRLALRDVWRRSRPLWTRSAPPNWHLFGDRRTIDGHEDNPYEIIRILPDGTFVRRGVRSQGYITEKL